MNKAKIINFVILIKHNCFNSLCCTLIMGHMMGSFWDASDTSCYYKQWSFWDSINITSYPCGILTLNLFSYKSSILIHSLNLLYTSPAYLSTLWTCCTQVLHLFHSLNSFHASSAPYSLSEPVAHVLYTYPLSEPVAHTFSILIHSLNLLHVGPAYLTPLWTVAHSTSLTICPQNHFFI